MVNKILKKDKLTKFAEEIMKKYVLYAPVMKNDAPMFKKISDPKNLTLTSLNTVISPKDIFFRQTEPMFSYELGKEKSITPIEPAEKAVVLGIRPCDAKSLSVIDAVFCQDYVDDYYLKRRENSILIGLTCNEPDLNCFCTSVGGSPSGNENIDIMLTDLGDKYLVEVLTEKGKNLFAETKSLFEDASSSDEGKKKQIEKASLEKFERTLDTKGLPEILNSLYENDIWEDISRICLGCNICTYSCPVCHCFDIQDECDGLQGCRVRIWDCCSNPEYTLHASGHNPRSTRVQRVRNKILHKFSFLPKNVDMFGCVGCGRCIELCPENWDILDAIERVRKVKSK